MSRIRSVSLLGLCAGVAIVSNFGCSNSESDVGHDPVELANLATDEDAKNKPDAVWAPAAPVDFPANIHLIEFSLREVVPAVRGTSENYSSDAYAIMNISNKTSHSIWYDRNPFDPPAVEYLGINQKPAELWGVGCDTGRDPVEIEANTVRTLRFGFPLETPEGATAIKVSIGVSLSHELKGVVTVSSGPIPCPEVIRYPYNETDNLFELDFIPDE